MSILLETDRLIITEMTMDMAMDVHKNSLDEDTRRFVPDEVFETLEDAKETLEFLISQYALRPHPVPVPSQRHLRPGQGIQGVEDAGMAHVPVRVRLDLHLRVHAHPGDLPGVPRLREPLVCRQGSYRR